MAPLALLLLFAATAYMLLWRTRPPPPEAPTLDSLPLRSLSEALGQAHGSEVDAAKLYAVVLVDAYPTLDLEAIVAKVRGKWGTHATPTAVATEDPPLRRSVGVPSAQIAFELITPIDQHPVLGEAAARPAGNAHAAAVLVTLEADKRAVLQAVALSQFVFALLDTCPQARAVLWAPSRTLWSATQAKRVLATDYEQRFPVGLWVSARASTLDDGRVQGYTLGLTALGSTEFEALDAREGPQALADRLRSLAEYALLSCRTIFNGDTTGVDGCERIRLQKVPSQTVHRGWVFQLRYLKASPQQPWEND
ncbi:MAG: DUF4261 domain-containing protein [Pseudomonadota bacterium]